MLRAVEIAWIEGVLEKSLYEEVLMALEVRERRDLIQPPVYLEVQTPDSVSQPFSPSADILDIFDEHGGRLSIFGEPGSGKTTLLLDLARKLIARAREDPHQPLPVVFNLASWAEKQPPLDEWLIDELENKYRVPKPLGRYWVEEHELLLMLDGLDEVQEDARGKCIQAINVYCDISTQVVVCSRRQEYESASAEVHLVMWQAIQLQPLLKTQIFTYLDALGRKADPVKKALEEDPDFLELSQTPLLLNVMLMAYGGETGKWVVESGSLEEKRSRLFDHYIHRVLLEHGSKEHPWPPSQVMTWLRWIARGLIQHNETEYRPENLQPDWLSPDVRRVYKWTVILIVVLIFVVIFELVLGLIGGRPEFALIASLVAGLITGMGFHLKRGNKITPVVGMKWTRHHPRLCSEDEAPPGQLTRKGSRFMLVSISRNGSPK